MDPITTAAPAAQDIDAAPVAPVAPVTDSDSDADIDLWAGVEAELDDTEISFDDDERPAPAPAPEPVAAVTEPAPAPTPVAPEVPPAPAPEPVAQVPVEPPAVVEPIAAVAEPQTSPEEMVRVRSEFLTQLEQSYALTPQEAQDLEMDIGKNMPRVAAQLHMRVAESITQTLAQILPQMITQQQQLIQNAQKGVNAFFEAWPELNRPEYHGRIAEVAELQRRLNPNASPEERRRAVGVQAWAMLGLPLDKLLTRGQAQSPAAPPSAPPTVSGGFAPANPGGGLSGGRLPGGDSQNPFEQLASEFLLDDD